MLTASVVLLERFLALSLGVQFQILAVVVFVVPCVVHGILRRGAKRS
jgi:hypothetical protein